MFRRALDVLGSSQDPEHQCRLAELHDLCGNPAGALGALKAALQEARGTVKADVCCALRNLEMRLGYHEEALEHAQAALDAARETASIGHLVKSLQGRGRTLEVLGQWREAAEDYGTAVHFHDECALALERPPHVDLFVLELRMGLINRAKATLALLERSVDSAGVAAKQMHLMLKSYMGVLLGYGEKAIPFALKAEETASKHGMKLYSGISSLYAGQLYIQAGSRERGIELIKKARATAHVLGDSHLVVLTDIELMFAGHSNELFRENNLGTRRNLAEENLAWAILSGIEVDESFSELLNLPSPLLACRLAEKCGFPSDSGVKNRLIKTRQLIENQLDPGEKDDYSRLFSEKWMKTSGPELSSETAARIMTSISAWIFDNLEGVADLESLRKTLNLKSLTTVAGAGMTKVPAEHPLYCSGENTAQCLPFLIPVAAAMAFRPETIGTGDIPGGTAGRITGDSKAIRRVRSDIERYAGEDVPILITGETGTGKEICAREIHLLSPRSKRLFVPVDCGAIPETLLESEFFGASPGAFTGIKLPRSGLIEEANGGTLFLDEIGNLPLHMQVKLLRAVDSGTFRRLGETVERKSDLRIVAATNIHIEDQVKAGTFRSDLYYRIAVVRVDIPPLRQRKEDIPKLAALFTGKRVSPGALALLESYSWPGNVRELLNVIRRAAITASGNTIRKCDISFNTIAGEVTEILSVHDALKAHIVRTVEALGGNRSRAAEVLKCDPKTIRRYLNG